MRWHSSNTCLPNYKLVTCIRKTFSNTQNLQKQSDGFRGVITRHKKDKRIGIAERLKFATWNGESKINIAVITEMEKLKGTKELDDYVMVYSGVTMERSKPKWGGNFNRQ